MNQNPYEPDHSHPDDYSRLYGNPNLHPYQEENNANLYRQNSEYQNYYRSSAPVITPPKQKKPKQPFSPIPLLLTAGVIFLFLGGIIFLTNTWDTLPDAVRAISLLSASLIAFGANVLAERVFKLQKTGLAFYILGCIFLPLALGGIGVFQLLGEWFSFDGEGASLLWSVIFLSISGSTFLGQKNYKNTILVWLSLSGTIGAWYSFTAFIKETFLISLNIFWGTFLNNILILAYIIGATVLCERYLRGHEKSYVTKAIPCYLYIAALTAQIHFLASAFLTAEAEHISAAEFILTACSALVTSVLFCNYRFIKNNFHAGIFGTAMGLYISGYLTAQFFQVYSERHAFYFIAGMSAIILMNLQQMPKLRTELTKTYSKAGLLFSIPVILTAGVDSLSGKNTGTLFLTYVLLLLGAIYFARSEKNPLPEDASFLTLTVSLLFVQMYCTSVLKSHEETEGNLLIFEFIISALILLAQAVIRRKLWPLVTAILTSAGVLLLNLENANLALLWMCAGGMLGGMIYAGRTWRFVLERCCAWGFLAFLTPVLQATLSQVMEEDSAWILTLGICGLLYLTETFLFRMELRANATRPYLETESILISIIALVSYLIDSTSKGFGILLCVLLLIFAGGFLRKDINAPAIPQLIMSFITAVNLIDQNDSVLVNVILYLALLVVYALMGRFLVPKFAVHEDGKNQTDWALLAGILPVFGAAFTIDWHPSILICLFLAVYSLLYIGRVQNRFIPTLMASAFSCLTIFFHNVSDPFEIFTALHDSEMKTPQVLLYLLPFHLFILSLLWILPEKQKDNVHKARFAMYCFTMFCLLVVSLNFKNASDAILLMVFSFIILMGSFSVKKLRWFTLGFAVLFLTTLRLTWKFWTSLHWGIYLFLAGIVLIAVASYTEYKNRYYAEHPDEPKKKFDFFKTWTW